MRHSLVDVNIAPARRALRVVAAVLLLVAGGWTGTARADTAEGATVLGTVVLAGGFCGAAAANMQPCRAPDAPAAGVELVFVPEGAAAASASAGVDGAGFLAARLKPGTYEVRLAHPNLSLRLDGTSLVVTAGQITQISLRLQAMRP